MARSCGIRLGPRRFEVVVLEGSPRKHKIVAHRSGEFDPEALDARQGAAVLKQATKKLGIPRECVGLVVDSGHAAFRRLSLPFSDRSKIEQVLKFEVESKLPQWNIEDVIVDYHVLAENNNSSDLLVSAVPKDDVKGALDVCTSAGIEPLEAELETSAMVNAACSAEICNLDDAQLLVHIGEYSTSVVIMDAGEVREMRVIHIGALTHENTPASEPEEPADDVEAEDGTPPEGLDVLEPLPPEPSQIQGKQDQVVKRIRRELGRTISGARTIHPVEAVYICGLGLPGMIGSTVLDVPVYELDCFDEGNGRPEEEFGSLVVAYGAALRELGGGPMKPSLRREELRFTGAWERIEFPVAVTFLLLATMLGVVFILQMRELQSLDRQGTRLWLVSSNNYMLGNPKNNTPGNLWPPPKSIADYAARFDDGAPIDPSLDPFVALGKIRAMIREEIKKVREELGQDSSNEQPQSALVGSQLVLEVLETEHKEWRPSIHKIQAVTQPARGKNPETVKVTLDVAFLADNSTQAASNYEAFRNAVSNQYWLANMPLKGFEQLDNGKGIFVQGLTISVDVGKYYQKQRDDALLKKR